MSYYFIHILFSPHNLLFILLASYFPFSLSLVYTPVPPYCFHLFYFYFIFSVQPYPSHFLFIFIFILFSSFSLARHASTFLLLSCYFIYILFARYNLTALILLYFHFIFSSQLYSSSFLYFIFQFLCLFFMPAPSILFSLYFLLTTLLFTAFIYSIFILLSSFSLTLPVHLSLFFSYDLLVWTFTVLTSPPPPPPRLPRPLPRTWIRGSHALRQHRGPLPPSSRHHHRKWTPESVAEPGIHRGSGGSGGRCSGTGGTHGGASAGASEVWEWHHGPEPPPPPAAPPPGSHLPHTPPASQGTSEECLGLFSVQ